MTEPSIPSTSAAPGGVVVSDAAEPARRSFLGTAWSALSAAIGTVMGLLPHVLHHVTLIARAALVTGVRGAWTDASAVGRPPRSRWRCSR